MEKANNEILLVENNILIKHFEGKRQGYLDLKEIGDIPCSFHPFIKKSEQIKFKLLKKSLHVK